jgi:hypothetical protein
MVHHTAAAPLARHLSPHHSIGVRYEGRGEALTAAATRLTLDVATETGRVSRSPALTTTGSVAVMNALLTSPTQQLHVVVTQ